MQALGDGRDERIFIGDKPFTFLRHNFDRVVKPGALRELLRDDEEGAEHRRTLREQPRRADPARSTSTATPGSR